MITTAAAIIGAAFIVSKYENGVYTGMAKADMQQNNKVQLPIVALTATDTAIAYSGDWEKTLSTSVVGVWGGSTTISTSSNQKLTPTEQLSHTIFTKYAEAQNAGQDVSDPNVQQGIITQVLTDGTVLPSARVYTQKDIKIENNNSDAALQQYGNAVAIIFTNNQSTSKQLETDIVQNSMNSNDPTILKQIDPFITSYQKIVSGLIATPVPSNMAAMHISLINAMNELLFGDQGFEKIYTDAMTSLSGISAYKQGIQDFPNALLTIKKYFVMKNITFDPKSPASIFNVQK